MLGCALLHRTARFANADIVRTRDPEKLAACDIVIDVGGECVPESMKFDHHQRSFTETFSDDKVRPCKVAAGWLVPTIKPSKGCLARCRCFSAHPSALLG